MENPIPNPNPMNFHDELTELNCLDIPSLDIDFLNNDDLGFDHFSFDNIDFNIDFDDLDLAIDGSDELSSTTIIDADSTGNNDYIFNSPSPNSSNFVCRHKDLYSGNYSEERVLNVSEPVSSHDSGVAGEILNSSSPESGFVSECNNTESDNGNQEDKRSVLKRKKDCDGNISNSNSSDRFSKVRKASDVEKVPLPEEDKKKTRLIRNRESAQLSRQRKKEYVGELENKVRSMAAVITDLNGRLSYFMAENVSLRQQLNSGNVPQAGVYPPPGMPYPWYPPAAYPMRTPGSQVPLVPIPRLKSKQPASVPKNKKSESKKSGSKVKKVSSVTFLGLLFCVFLFFGLVPLVNVRYGGKMGMDSSDFGFGISGFNNQPRGRVLTVSDHLNDSHRGAVVGYHNGKSNLRECGANRDNCRRVWVEGEDSKEKQGLQTRNSSDPLLASLYIPRNDKLVKIDGNLIIQSVLASEKAMASRTTSEKKKTPSPANESPETGLVIAGHPHMYRSSSVQQKALKSGPSDSCKDRPRSPTSDGSLQKWFLEGLSGPILSSGMCTEVFQFDVSSSINPGAIIPASSVNISMVTNDSVPARPSKRNRRSLNHLPILLPEFNHSKEHSGIPPHKNGTVPSMVVSILADPKEAGDLSVDGGISPKSLSRIFVVVLIDSVKYVTYSCMLPFKGVSSSHLVTT